MKELFKNKFRTQTIRARWWDYGGDGHYFITIITANRIQYFGKISEGKMKLSEIGSQAEKCWLDIPNHFPFVVLDVFVIMPDHIHGIVIIDKSGKPNDGRVIDNGIVGNGIVGDGIVEAQNLAPLRISRPPQFDSIIGSKSPANKKNNFGPQSKNLASVVRGFKIGVTKYCI